MGRMVTRWQMYSSDSRKQRIAAGAASVAFPPVFWVLMSPMVRRASLLERLDAATTEARVRLSKGYLLAFPLAYRLLHVVYMQLGPRRWREVPWPLLGAVSALSAGAAFALIIATQGIAGPEGLMHAVFVLVPTPVVAEVVQRISRGRKG